MRILATLFESGLVDEVDLADVLQLFGIPAPDEHINRVFSFSDPEWIEAYLDFTGFEGEVIVLDAEGNELDDANVVTKGIVMPSDGKLH